MVVGRGGKNSDYVYLQNKFATAPAEVFPKPEMRIFSGLLLLASYQCCVCNQILCIWYMVYIGTSTYTNILLNMLCIYCIYCYVVHIQYIYVYIATNTYTYILLCYKTPDAIGDVEMYRIILAGCMLGNMRTDRNQQIYRDDLQECTTCSPTFCTNIVKYIP